MKIKLRAAALLTVMIAALLAFASPSWAQSNGEADLEIIKVGPDKAYKDGSFFYLFGVNNYGPDDATGVEVTDQLPGSLEFVSAYDNDGDGQDDCSYNAGSRTVTCGPVDLAADGSVYFYILVKPTQEGEITNTASVKSNETDPNLSDNEDSETITVSPAAVDLYIDKYTTDSPSNGDSFFYYLDVYNDGSLGATGVTVSDTLPQGVEFVSARGVTYNPSGGENQPPVNCSYNAGSRTVTCDPVNLAVYDSATYDNYVFFEIEVTATQEGEITNTAHVQSNETDADLSDNEDSETTVVTPAADPPANDNFASAEQLTGTSTTASGTNKGATKETGEPDHAGNPGGKSVWYKWTPQASGTASIDTSGSDFDTLLGVYTGSAVNGLTEVASNDDEDTANGVFTSKVDFPVTAGTTYQIAVDGYNFDTGSHSADSGNITLKLGASATTPPETGIDAGPPATTTSTSATFRFSSSKPGSTFRCSLDNAAFSSCASPTGYSNLSIGTHTFQVKAVDHAGNEDPTPASRTWTINAPAHVIVDPQQPVIGPSPQPPPPAPSTPPPTHKKKHKKKKHHHH